jgi:uncharacterized membrane protein YhdT
MTSFTPENIRARKIALWVCSVLGLIFIVVLAIKATTGMRPFEARIALAVILLLMLFTGIMHAFRKELRIPAIALATASNAALLILFFGAIHS